jgi:hypothetical protein
MHLAIGQVRTLIRWAEERASDTSYNLETFAEGESGASVRQPLQRDMYWHIYAGYIEEVREIYRRDIWPVVRDTLLEEMSDEDHYVIIEAAADLMLAAHRLDHLYKRYVRVESPGGLADFPINVAPMLRRLPKYVETLSQFVSSGLLDDRMIRLLDEQIDLVDSVRKDSETHHLGNKKDLHNMKTQVQEWKWALEQRREARP